MSSLHCQKQNYLCHPLDIFVPKRHHKHLYYRLCTAAPWKLYPRYCTMLPWHLLFAAACIVSIKHTFDCFIYCFNPWQQGKTGKCMQNSNRCLSNGWKAVEYSNFSIKIQPLAVRPCTKKAQSKTGLRLLVTSIPSVLGHKKYSMRSVCLQI